MCKPEALQCPSGTTEVVVGELNDIGGCGLEGCNARYDDSYATIEECRDGCEARADCASFTWTPVNGDQNHQGTTVCTLYSSDVPNQQWGPDQIMCRASEVETAGFGACVENRGGCWDLGFKDNVADTEACKDYCATVSECAFWSYKALQAHKRCHVCSKNEDWFSAGSCDVEGSCPWGPVVCDADSAMFVLPQSISPVMNKNVYVIDLSSISSANVWTVSLFVLCVGLAVCVVKQMRNSAKGVSYAKVQFTDVEMATDEDEE
jgi:hypothetical protein